MSLLNVSIGDERRFGIISTDSRMWNVEDDPFSKNWAQEPISFESIKESDTSPSLGTKFFDITKIASLPHLSSVVAGNGSALFNAAVIGALSNLPCNDITELPSAAEHVLQTVHEQIGKEHGYVGAVIGWSKVKQGVFGWQFRHWDDFVMHPVTEALCQPPVNPEDSGIQNLELLAQRAGTNVDGGIELHKAIAENQYRAYQAGLYPKGFHCGGELHCATVNATGISITKKDFPEHRHSKNKQTARVMAGAFMV